MRILITIDHLADFLFCKIMRPSQSASAGRETSLPLSSSARRYPVGSRVHELMSVVTQIFVDLLEGAPTRVVLRLPDAFEMCSITVRSDPDVTEVMNGFLMKNPTYGVGTNKSFFAVEKYTAIDMS